MVAGFHKITQLKFLDRTGLLNKALSVSIAFFTLSSWEQLKAQQGNEDIPDISGKYHFLSADDNLGLLEEEGKLKGYIDVFQGEDESDTILSYPITIGSRKKNHVEFKTGKIHQKYYRFTGVVERGSGHEETDPDYLRLIGDLEIVTAKAENREALVQRMHVIFKSLGKGEREED